MMFQRLCIFVLEIEMSEKADVPSLKAWGDSLGIPTHTGGGAFLYT